MAEVTHEQIEQVLQLAARAVHALERIAEHLDVLLAPTITIEPPGGRQPAKPFPGSVIEWIQIQPSTLLHAVEKAQSAPRAALCGLVAFKANSHCVSTPAIADCCATCLGLVGP